MIEAFLLALVGGFALSAFSSDDSNDTSDADDDGADEGAHIEVHGFYENVTGTDADDTIIVSGHSNTVDGGDGDDTIDGRNSDYSNLYGGAGNDEIWSGNPIDEGYDIDGGDGDDILHVMASDYQELYTPTATGGEGSDVFDVMVSVDPHNGPESIGALVITDFVAGEDQIQISPEIFETHAGQSSSFYDVTVEDTDDGSVISVLFAIQSESDPTYLELVNSNILLEGTSGLTLDDIIVNGEPVGDLIYQSGGPDFFGTDGNDIVADNYYETRATIDGGSGNDILLGGFGLVSGGEGDDVLIGSDLDGGEGNDILFGYSTVHDNGGHGISGGAGDDYIVIEASGSYVYYPPIVSGGEGSDIFNVRVSEAALDVVDQSQNDTVITDYNRDEDILQLTLPGETNVSSYLGYGEDFSLSDVAIETDGADSVIVVTYAYDGSAPDVPSFVESTIRIEGVSDLTLDDIVFSSDDDFVAPPEAPQLRSLLRDAGYVS